MSDYQGRAQFYPFGEQANCNSLSARNLFAVQTGMEPIATISVECDSLENFVIQHMISSIDLVKINTEGCVLKVLNGARDTLAST